MNTLSVIPFSGFGTADTWHLRGRVLAGPLPTRAAGPTRAHRNLLNALRRLRSRSVPGARVHVEGVHTRADDEGYWAVQLAPPPGLAPDGRWHPVQVAAPDAGPGAVAVGHVLVPSATAQIGIVSDVDDTIIRTDVTHMVRMLRTVLLNNAHTRLPFPGIAAFYRALHAGTNPIFYVSSSPWELYDLLEHIWDLHGIPAGPMFLRDYDFEVRDLFGGGHQDHKLVAIRTLMDLYPRLEWVLIGDSGQHDPEVYCQVAREYPGRVRAVYIRDVTDEQRDRAVHAVADQVRAMKIPMLLVPDTTTAAEHAAVQGLVSPVELEAIRAGARADAHGSGPAL